MDLNADVGEGCGHDDAIIPLVTRCNIACGGHAGDEASMRRALRLAKAAGVLAGAHPSYPDRAHFGRRPMTMAPEELQKTLETQLRTLVRFADEEGLSLSHVKPHGALYHAAAKGEAVAQTVVDATMTTIGAVAVIGPPSSVLGTVAERCGLPFLVEGFVDRAYDHDGQLRDRAHPDAILPTDGMRVEQALTLAQGGYVKALGGEIVHLTVQTLCLHGDTPGAVQSAQHVRNHLIERGVYVGAPVLGKG